MLFGTTAISRARRETRDDLQMLKTLAVFCGVGLVLSLAMLARATRRVITFVPRRIARPGAEHRFHLFESTAANVGRTA